MKVLDYALNALAAATDVAQDPRHHAGVSYPTLGFNSPHAARGPIETPTVTTYATLRPAATHHAIPVIRPRNSTSNDQPPDLSKPMLGLYPEDQVTIETTTFENGIDSSKWIIDTRQYGGAEYNPYMRKMDPENVKVEDGLLKLTVPGGQTYDPKSQVGLSSAQIMTTKKISIGSLEMKVKMSSVEGTCQCGFLYGADNNEVDMEYLTRTKVSWAVIQGMGREQPIQQVDLNVTTDQTDGWHTYKLVRTENKAFWIVDGQLVNTFNKNIPTQPVQMMVAHWTDANPGWTGGPPEKDAVMTVEKVTVEYVGATEVFTTSTATPSATGAPTSSPSKDAASSMYGSDTRPLWAMAALSFFFAL